MTQAVENRLPKAGFNVISLPSDIDKINKHRHSTDIFLCHFDYTSPATESVLHYLADLCRDEHRSMCLIVDSATRVQVTKMESAQLAAHIYVRPLDMNDIVDDLTQIAKAHDELRRTKTLLVVDDDEDFLLIMKHWLSKQYNVIGVHSGVAAVMHLKNHTPPDLILLDYEMPVLDGYDVMQWKRLNAFFEIFIVSPPSYRIFYPERAQYQHIFVGYFTALFSTVCLILHFFDKPRYALPRYP